jgi:hypothetical protein
MSSRDVMIERHAPRLAAGAQRALPCAVTGTYSDDYLDYWADVYVGRAVRDYGVQLEYFLMAPHQILDWIGTGRLRCLDDLAREAYVQVLRETVATNTVARH